MNEHFETISFCKSKNRDKMAREEIANFPGLSEAQNFNGLVRAKSGAGALKHMYFV